MLQRVDGSTVLFSPQVPQLAYAHAPRFVPGAAVQPHHGAQHGRANLPLIENPPHRQPFANTLVATKSTPTNPVRSVVLGKTVLLDPCAAATTG